MLIRELWGEQYDEPGNLHEDAIGIEIEIEGANSHRVIGRRQVCIDDDGSLRDGGVEFISVPVEPEEVEELVLTMYDMIAESRGRGTVRTGTHVHFNMLDRTLDQVMAICTLYSILEPALYSLLPPERSHGIYCIPWYSANDQAEVLRDAAAQTSPSNARAHLSRACKYSGLNLLPLRTLGTLEFRMAPTFKEPEELLNWIGLLRDVVQIGTKIGKAEEVLDRYSGTCLEEAFGIPNADRLVAEADSWAVAEILAGNDTYTWQLPDVTPSPITPPEEAREEEPVVRTTQMQFNEVFTSRPRVWASERTLRDPLFEDESAEVHRWVTSAPVSPSLEDIVLQEGPADRLLDEAMREVERIRASVASPVPPIPGEFE